MSVQMAFFHSYKYINAITQNKYYPYRYINCFYVSFTNCVSRRFYSSRFGKVIIINDEEYLTIEIHRERMLDCGAKISILFSTGKIKYFTNNWNKWVI